MSNGQLAKHQKIHQDVWQTANDSETQHVRARIIVMTNAVSSKGI
jgi:hypothetical protein